jgi:asparagine synthetase B (glutamine-hydrolysing)
MALATAADGVLGARTRPGARSWIARLGDAAGRTDLELTVGAQTPSLELARDAHRTVVLEGILHDARDLLGAVAEPGPPPESDAELVLRAYERIGPQLLEHLRGAFALLLWDRSAERLMCARDQLGLHPLFYAQRGPELFVSTAIHDLVAQEGVPGAVNRAALADHLCHRWPDPGETYFDAIRRIPPAHVLRVEAGVARLERYWDPVPPGSDAVWVTEDELERFDGLLDQAVDRCLARGPAAIFLSGGLDSVSVAAVAAEKSRAREQEPPQALSLIFPDPECNEAPVQRGVARTLALPHLLLDFEEALPPEGLVASALKLSSERAQPLVSYWTPAYLTLARQGKQAGRETILTGHGGDEWLTVSPYHAADLVRSLDFAGLARLWAAQRRSFNVPSRQLARRLLWSFSTRLLLRSAAASVLRSGAPGALRAHRLRAVRSSIPAWVAPDAALRDDLVRRGLEAWPARSGESYYLHEVRSSLDHPLVSMEMEEVFDNGRAVGTRVLPPYLDADLVDFLYRTPPHLLDRGGRSKGLVRERLAQRFPELGFERQRKVAATSYSRSVMTEEAPRNWKRMGGIPALAELGIADPRSFGPLLDSAARGDRVAQFRMWDALNLEAWTRSHL